MKHVWKWVSNIFTVVVGLMLAVTMYSAITSRIHGTPTIFGLRVYEVLSGSMAPGIKTGSIILDKQNVDPGALKVGDVITFHAPANEYGANESIITHRIYKVVDQGGQVEFQTKGDANNAPDPALVPASNVIAEYDNVTIPYLGYYFVFAKSKLGIALAFILPGFFLLLSSVLSLYREFMKGSSKEKGVRDINLLASLSTKRSSRNLRRND